MSGDTAIIGAVLDDDNGTSAGSAYVLRREGRPGEHEPVRRRDHEPHGQCARDDA